MSSEFTVVLADDHAPTRTGVRLAIESDGFRVVAEVDTGGDAVAAALHHRPQLCLLDIYMPGDGIAAAETICAQLPATRIVMLTVSSTDDDLLSSLRAGADGYLLKTTAPDRLPLALRALMNGEACLPRALTQRVVEEVRRRSRLRRLPLRDRSVALTDREVEVLELMRDGFSTATMAERMGISQVTVRRHISTSLKKLDMPDRSSALRLLEEGEAETRPFRR